MSNVIKLAGTRDLPKSKKSSASRMDTILLTPSGVRAWKLPPFQRQLRVNEKVRCVAEELKCNSGAIPGVLTLGELGRETYLLDGQHRVEAFLISGLEEGIADVRIVSFEDMAEMGQEFVMLNSSIVKMRPDDVLRGLEGTLLPLREIRKHCPFVGYDYVRRGTSGPLLSMGTAIRCWINSAKEPPQGGGAVAEMARQLQEHDANGMIQFLNCCHAAWGRDPEYWRLWGALNLTIVGWLWRNTVIGQYSHKSPKINADVFIKCAMSLSADGTYVEWLHGRPMNPRDLSPCYSRIKSAFGKRLKDITGKLPNLPAPPWSNHQVSHRVGK